MVTSKPYQSRLYITNKTIKVNPNKVYLGQQKQIKEGKRERKKAIWKWAWGGGEQHEHINNAEQQRERER